MEGVGSRLGRASSRYGGSAPVFSGPVRKWKKQWVTSQPNSIRGNVAGPGPDPKLMLCRWTPLSSNKSDDSPKRKFRYAPIVDLEEKKREKEALDNEKAKIRKLNQTITSATSSDNILRKQDINDLFDEDFEELRTDQSIFSETQVNFDLCLEGCD